MRENGLQNNTQPNYPVQPKDNNLHHGDNEKKNHKQLEEIHMKIEFRIDRKEACIWSEFMSILCINMYPSMGG